MQTEAMEKAILHKRWFGIPIIVSYPCKCSIASVPSVCQELRHYLPELMYTDSGFLAGEATAKDGALNAGIRGSSVFEAGTTIIMYRSVDQQFALQWVQDHVSVRAGRAHVHLQRGCRSPNSVAIRTKSPSTENQRVQALFFNTSLRMVEIRNPHCSAHR